LQKRTFDFDMRRGTTMKKVMLLTIFAALMMISSAAVAQTTASGTLNVTATVNGSIQLIFISDGAGVQLSGSGTSTATLAFGNVSAFGALGANISRTVVAGTSFTVSTPVDVQVNKTNTASANYTLTAQLGAADAVNTWQVSGTTVTSASAATITATGTYGSQTAETIAITVPNATPSGTLISNSIKYLATAN
jgi:hypothetical protein